MYDKKCTESSVNYAIKYTFTSMYGGRNMSVPQRFRHQNHGFEEGRRNKDGNHYGNYLQKPQYPVQSFFHEYVRKV